eukprot:TCONS_00058509-protein
MRWHPLIIRWCIGIYLKSPGTYKGQLQQFLNLPSKNTLLKYINYTDPGCGFNPDTIANIARQFDALEKPHQSFVSLVVDEMKIKSGLCFSTSTGKIVGLCEEGSINDLLSEFELKYSEEESENQRPLDSTDRELASYATALMVRGISSNLFYVFGHFASSSGMTSSQLYHVIWEGISLLESIDLKVLAIVADGASTNRKFFKLHNWETKENFSPENVIYWTWNECCPTRKLYFICDPPHLMKTTRNNLEKSSSKSTSRNLMCDGQSLSWGQIINLYEWDLGMERDAIGLTMGHHLTEEHINLNPRSRMRVYLAVQVLSATVVNMLDEQDLHTTKSLRTFISHMNRFFDCLNVSKSDEKSNNLDKHKYRGADDERFGWLVTTFLKYLNDWEAHCYSIPNLTKIEQSKLCLSHQTLEGLRITVRSFIEVSKVMFNEGAKYILSEKLSQDPLEEYFGKQRMRLGCNENPTLSQFNFNALAIGVAGDLLVRPEGNSRGKHNEQKIIDVNDMSLPPKKKTKPS